MTRFRCQRRVSRVNSFPLQYQTRFGHGDFEAGDVVRKTPTFGFGAGPEHWEQLPDPCDDPLPTTIEEVAFACDTVLKWIHDGQLADATAVTRQRLVSLVDAAAMLPDAPCVPFDAVAVRSANTLPKLVTLAKQLKHWAASLPATEATPATASTQNDDGYRPASDLLKPEGWPKNYKELQAALNEHPEIRRRRPRSKAGTPIPNRLQVHLLDWLKYLDQRGATPAPDPLDLPVEAVDRAV